MAVRKKVVRSGSRVASGRSEVTSKRVATMAAKVLNRTDFLADEIDFAIAGLKTLQKSVKLIRSVAGSALTQTPAKRPASKRGASRGDGARCIEEML